MKARLGRMGDLLYAAVYGLLVTLIVWLLGDLLAVAAGARENALAGWSAFVLAVALCVGIGAARAIRWQRRRAASR